MAILRTLLVVLMVVRLLLPPGLCICKSSTTAMHTLAWVLGTDISLKKPQADLEDDHEPGCPASYLSAGMGVPPAPGPAPELLGTDLPASPLLDTLSAQPLSPASPSIQTEPASRYSTDPPLFLSHCALTV